MIELVKKALLEARSGLDSLISNESSLDNVVKASNMMIESIKSGGKILSFGNGGSCSDAMHFAEELAGKFRKDRSPIPAFSVSDPSYLTCVANDYGYESVFARYVAGFCSSNDCVLGISTSGSSKNVVEAIKVAKDRGVKTVTLTGREGSVLEGLADICICKLGVNKSIQTLHSKSKNSPFVGWNIHAENQMTIYKGKIAYRKEM